MILEVGRPQPTLGPTLKANNKPVFGAEETILDDRAGVPIKGLLEGFRVPGVAFRF